MKLIFCVCLFVLTTSMTTPVYALKPLFLRLQPVTISTTFTPQVTICLHPDKLRHEMENAFEASGKFHIIADTQEERKADFILAPNVTRFLFYSRTRAVPNVKGNFFRNDFGTLEMETTVFTQGSTLPLTSFFLSDSFATRKRVVTSPEGVPNSKYCSAMVKTVAKELVEQFIFRIYPLKIVEVKEGKVLLNPGEAGHYSKGTLLDVYTKPVGEERAASFGGETVGAIRIIDVSDEMIEARIVKEKSPGSITTGAIARKRQPVQN